MHLAACLDLGVPKDWLESELSKLSLSGEYQILAQPAIKMGISGTQVKVEARDQHDHRHHSTIVDLITKAGLDAGVEARALAEPTIAKLLHGDAPKKVIVVPGRIVNLVV